MELTFLGTGTSHGVPVIACDCKVCKSSDPRDKRLRSSVYIHTNDDKYILIDIGPEFRIQCLENNIKKIDAVLLTHSHADHLHGIDDLRVFSCELWKEPDTEEGKKKCYAPPMPIYTNSTTIKDLENRFDYFFRKPKEGGGHAKVELNDVSSSFFYGTTKITPIPMLHGHLETSGWLLTEENNGLKESIAYLTDCSFISEDSIKLLKENGGTIKHLIIDGLRIKEHSTHFNFLQAMECAEKIGGDNVWITHITHNSSHVDAENYLNEHKSAFKNLTQNIHCAYDRLKIKI